MLLERNLSDREALECFKELHPELASAHQIVGLTEADFASRYAGDFYDGERQARRVYQTAVDINDRMALAWANIKDITSPYLRQARFNNVPDSFLAHLEKIPGYDRIFGSLDFIECEHCRSIFGPAAYFVDLLRFVEKHIVDANRAIPANSALAYRRPDLAHLKLDCHNTHDLIPYVDLVAEILEGVLRAQGEEDPYAALASADYPMDLPLNLPLLEIRAYLKQLKTSLHEIYTRFAQFPESDRNPITREFLELSPDDFSLIVSVIAAPDDLSRYYGLDVTLFGSNGLENLAHFLAQTGLNREQVNELIYQDLDRHEVNAGLSRLFFINNVDDGLGPITLEQAVTTSGEKYEKLANLSLPKLDRIYRFLKLARYLAWSFAELDWALRSLQEPYRSETALKFDGLNDYVACRDATDLDLTTFTIEAWVNPSQYKRNPIIAQGIESTHTTNILLWIDSSGKLAFYNDSEVITGNRNLVQGEFSHVAAVYDGEQLALYVNGQLDALEPRPLTMINRGRDLNIGRNLNDHYFEGMIKDVRIWGVARSQIEITNNRFRRLTGLENDLLGYWPLTENRWNRLVDRTSRRNDGVLGGDEFVTQPVWVQRDLVLDPFPKPLSGTGYHFDGRDQYLAARDVSGLDLQQFTIETWVTIEELQDSVLVCKGNENNGRTHFLLSINGAGHLVFKSTSIGKFASSGTLTPQRPTHICLAISESSINFYIDGVLDSTHSPAALGNMVIQGQVLNVGRKFSGHYFAGSLKELRIWDRERSHDQILMNMHRLAATAEPGLVSYWRFDGTEKTADLYLAQKGLDVVRHIQALDLSYNKNHLYLGGLPEDYEPDRIQVETLVPSSPVVTEGTILHFDGDNDVVTIRNRDNAGLGKYERWTVAFWFRADEAEFDREQVLFAQGDGEAGLAVYLLSGALTAVAWNANYELTDVDQVVLTADPVRSDQWHHVAITSDESKSLDRIELNLYLDGGLAGSDQGFRLSPVGPAYLGGLAKGVITRLATNYTGVDKQHRYFFAGQIAHLQLWKNIRAGVDIDHDRWLAPIEPDDDLLAYLPINESKGYEMADQDRDPTHNGRLQINNMALVTYSSDVDHEQVFAHYADPDALAWTDYVYSGRLYITGPDQAIGVSVLSRHPEDVDQCYILRRTLAQPTFHLVAHPEGIQEVEGILDSATDPQPNTWYRFLIRVNATGDQTMIDAKVWPDETPEPDAFQIQVIDNGHIRIRAGTVGIWTEAGGEKYVDDLLVWPTSATKPDSSTMSLDENFEAYAPDADPDEWRDTRVQRLIEEDPALFKTMDADGQTVLGITGDHSELEDVHCHYDLVEALDWNKYVFSGRFQITDENQAIGVTFFSRFPKSDRYYRLRRYQEKPTLHLAPHPHGAHILGGQVDSGVNPKPNAWYRFYLEVEDGEAQTEIRAKVWLDGEDEPAAFQVLAHDAGENRIRSGTVGLWTLGPGTKLFDDLQVAESRLLAENFARYPADTQGEGWTATKVSIAHDETEGIFKVASVDNRLSYGADGSQAEMAHFHAHYNGPRALSWTNYVYTGRFFLANDQAAMGLTFLSRFPDGEPRYYRLGRTADRPSLHLTNHPYGFPLLAGSVNSGVVPEEQTWYRFRIEVEDRDDRTYIRAKVWPASEPEPEAFVVEAYDESDSRLTSGIIGIWGIGRDTGGSAFYVDELWVGRHGGSPLLFADDFRSYGAGAAARNWRDSYYIPEGVPREPFTQKRFRVTSFDNNNRLFTDSQLEPWPGIKQKDPTFSHYHSAHYVGGGAADWTNYVFSGRLYISESDGGIGVTVLSRRSGEYRFIRDEIRPGFRLIAAGTSLKGDTSTGVEPNHGVWYRFRIVASDTGSRTRIRAKIWAGSNEPDYQIDAYDDSPNRLRSGTIGVWTNGPGAKLFDDFRVVRLALLAENFGGYAVGSSPRSWSQTRSRALIEAAGDQLATVSIENNMAVSLQGVGGPAEHFQAHIGDAASLAWTNYIYSGRVRLQSAENAVGVTFFSHYGDGQDRYYCLRRDARHPTWQLDSNPFGIRRLQGTVNSESSPEPGIWYRFRIIVTDQGQRTEIRAKVWPDGSPEPQTYLLEAYDDSPDRLTAGAVGVWTTEAGRAFFDDLTVYHDQRLAENFDAYEVATDPEHWLDTRTRSVHTVDDTLFKIQDVKGNLARWRRIRNYPVLMRPLDTGALKFDGRLEYMAAETAGLEDLDAFTIEAWVRPPNATGSSDLPVWSIGGTLNSGEPFDLVLSLGDESSGRELLLGGSAAGKSAQGGEFVDGYNHLTLVVDVLEAIAFVNGVEAFRIQLPWTESTRYQIGSLEIGRGSAGNYLHGQIRDLRLWSGSRENDLAVDIRYQKPLPGSELIGHWPLAESDGVLALDGTDKANHLRLGGLVGARQPNLTETSQKPTDWPYTALSTVLAFSGPADGLHLSWEPIEAPVQRRTIEVWFSVSDKNINHRKQVIYQEGDGQRGLVIYIYDGQLCFGGYNIPEANGDLVETRWAGTWLCTSRIDSGKWHHAALVLDGRQEMRPGSLRAYLDGKQIDVGDGCQLWRAPSSFTLGGSHSGLRFASGVAEAEETPYFEGQILDLRLWQTVRSTEEIRSNRAQQLAGDETHLALWAQFSDAAVVPIVDRLGVGKGDLQDLQARLRPLTELPPYSLPGGALNAKTLTNIARIKKLKEKHRLSIDKLCAFWHDLKHMGREDQRTLFDRVFNPQGIVQDRWAIYTDVPLRWDVTGQRESQQVDKAIRGRLMATLRLSHDDLNRLVTWRSGPQTTITLTNAYLTDLYRLAKLASAMRLSISALLKLLKMMGMNTVSDIDAFVRLAEKVAWMKQTGLDVYELDFLLNDRQSKKATIGYDEAAIRNLADELNRQSVDFFAHTRVFESDEIDAALSDELYNFFTRSGFIEAVKGRTDAGSVAVKYPASDFTLLAAEPGWAARLREALAAEVLNKLRFSERNGVVELRPGMEFTPEQVEAMKASLGAALLSSLKELGFLNEHGFVQPEGDNRLDEPQQAELLAGLKGTGTAHEVLFADTGALSPPVLTAITDILNRWQTSQDTIGETLNRLRAGQETSLLDGLSNLVDAEQEVLSVIIAFFGKEVPPKLILEWLLSIVSSNADIPQPLTEYLYKVSKVLYLVEQFNYTAGETRSLLQHPENFQVSSVLKPTLSDLDNLYAYRELRQSLGDDEGRLLPLFQLDAADEEGLQQAIAAVTGWDTSQLQALMAHFPGDVAYNRAAGLNRLRCCFELALSMGVDVTYLIRLARHEPDTPLTYDFYHRQAASLLNVLRAKYHEDKWPKIYRPIRDKLALQKRDALLSLIMLNVGTVYQGRKTPDILSEYFLIDVQTSSEVDTSRLVQAIASLQLYVQRSQMNLEEGVNPEQIPAEEWDWRRNYRVWEANRKVFLYPENYIEPELRDTKSPLFEELEQELLQGDVDQVAVEKAYVNYLDKYAEVANLKIVGSYLHTDDFRKPIDERDEVLYLVGQTRKEPRTHYYRVRERVNGGTIWRPWKEIEVPINAEFISPVYAFNKLFLFWVETMKKTKSVEIKDARGNPAKDDQGNIKHENVDVYVPTIKFSYYNFSKSWVQAQTLHVKNEDGHEKELDETSAQLDGWKRIVAQRSFKLEPPKKVVDREANALVLQIDNQTHVERRVANHSPHESTWSFWLQCQDIYQGDRTNPDPTHKIPAGTVTLVDYAGRFKATATNKVTEIPGAIQAYNKAVRDREAADAAYLEADGKWREAKEALDKDPKNTDKQKAESAARKDRDLKQDLLTKATNKETEERTKPKWEIKSVIIRFQTDPKTPISIELPTGGWRHVALTMRHNASAYQATVYAGDAAASDSRPITSGRLPADLLPTDGQLILGQTDANAAGIFTTQMSEFRLWAYARSSGRIARERNQRKLGTEVGLTYLPLNRSEPGMQPVRSSLNFEIPRPEPIPVVDDERLVVFYGDVVASIHNDLEEQSYILSLDNRYRRFNYDVTLTMSSLHIMRREGLSINDYVDSAVIASTVGSKTTKINLRGLSPRQIQEYVVRWQVEDAQINARNQFRRVLRHFGYYLEYEPLLYTDLIRAAQAYLDELADPFNQANYLLKDLPAFDSSVTDVGNQPGWYIVDTGHEQFLMEANVNKIETVGERMHLLPGPRSDALKPQPVSIYYVAEKDKALEMPSNRATPRFKFNLDRLSTYAIHDLSRKLFKGGIDLLLSPASQKTSEWDFNEYKANGRLINPPGSKAVDFEGPNGLYYQEIFFHIPFFIANRLNGNQRFTEAQRWYHYIFNPTAQEASGQMHSYWRYLPFKDPFEKLSKETLSDMLIHNERALAAYRRDPFDPHAIARLRLFAYQKAIVMKYIDNLLDWGDYLFSQDTRESINEAVSIYILAYDLLGPRPEGKAVKDFREIGDYAAIKRTHTTIPDFLAELEKDLPGSAVGGPRPPNPHSHIAIEFCVIENEHFVGYWDRVEDRLYKIRHSLNIAGIFRQLALFEPPIDPMVLVRAVAAGRNIGDALSDLGVPVPHYRYSFMLDKAKEMAGRVIDLGSALLSALESKDAERLALLQNSHEQQILNLMTDMKAYEREAVAAEIEELTISERSINEKIERYKSLVENGLSVEEEVEFGLLIAAQATKSVAVVLKSIAAAFAPLPPVITGGAGLASPVFVTSVKPESFYKPLDFTSQGLEIVADILNSSAGLTGKMGAYKRRESAWKHEQKLAEYELEQIEKQKAIAELRRKIAEREIAIHAKNMEHNQEVAQFYSSKFSNQALYSWMANRLSALYFQTYKLAHDMAKSAEKAAQFELPTNDTFISFGHWDSLKKGLLAGESLLLDLDRMDKAYLERYSRFLEMEKSISMKRTFPGALLLLATTGVCEFELSELLFNLDFPGHYGRMIKTISISVQADIDRHDGLKATLVQLGSKTLLEQDIGAVRYLMGVEGAEPPGAGVVRSNWRANQQIAISRPKDDHGMFVLNFFLDDQYFPFEGTGAVSYWRLEMPRKTNRFEFDLEKDDVIIHLRYTSFAGDDAFKKEVVDEVDALSSVDSG